MTSLRPSPVMVLTPVLGEAATTSLPPWSRMGAVFDPIRPVPPITTIFMFRFLSSIGSECSLQLARLSYVHVPARVLPIGPSTAANDPADRSSRRWERDRSAAPR